MHAASFFIALAAMAGIAAAAPALYPGEAPGKAQANVSEGSATLGNDAFTATYKDEGGAVTFSGLTAADGTQLIEGGTPLFTIVMKDGSVLDSTNMKGRGLSTSAARQNTDGGEGKPGKGADKAKSSASQPSESASERDSAEDSPAPVKKKKKKKKAAAGKTAKGAKAAGKAPAADAKGEGRKALYSEFTAPDGSFTVTWRAALTNNAHYLRHSMIIRAQKPLEVQKIVALDFNAAPGTGMPSISGNTTHGCVVVNKQLFFGLETPMSVMTVGGKANAPTSSWTPNAWKTESFGPVFNLPASFREAYGNRYAATNGPVLTSLKQAEGPVSFSQGGNCRITFRYKEGRNKLNIVGVQLLDSNGQVVNEDVHEGSAAQNPSKNTYTVAVPKAGDYRLRYWAQTLSEEIDSQGSIVISLPLAQAQTATARTIPNKVQGSWFRKAKLEPGQVWSVTGVAGLLVPGQERRSFLAYVERERAVPYRPFVHYNDWYEIGIRVHDNQDPKERTSESFWMNVLNVWQKELVQKRKTKIDAFVVDDGWDDFNSLWDFHCGFPTGFSKLSKKATKMGAGIGTWLGPVGGYGSSKGMRIAYWNSKHPRNKIDNFQLSNQEYFDAFVGRCTKMIKDYDMRYFKFDGISTKFHAKGPEDIEDAEGIIGVIRELRKARPDIFINTTVGTWASPFWLMHADSIWRQENDFDQAGTAGDPRDKWITYRDRLVYEVYVQGAPLCPINSIMTHGTMITKNGPPNVMSKDPENCRKEIRMAFGYGSSLQEIYADHDLLAQKNGALWNELAACIAWVRRNADVLPDVHWVGGNPWNGSDGDIYGFAAWNKTKATLTLRNSSAKEKTLNTTLRRVLDVPKNVKGSVTFRNSFDDQRKLPGLTGSAVDVDADIAITLKPQEVIVLEGKCAM